MTETLLYLYYSPPKLLSVLGTRRQCTLHQREIFSSHCVSSSMNLPLEELHDLSPSRMKLWMTQPVKSTLTPMCIMTHHGLFVPVAPGDYISASGELVFAVGDTRMCHDVQIVNDGICERPEIEQFFSNLELVSGLPIIDVDPPTAAVLIDDSVDCGGFFFYCG